MTRKKVFGRYVVLGIDEVEMNPTFNIIKYNTIRANCYY
jgi:hypothetical protein